MANRSRKRKAASAQKVSAAPPDFWQPVLATIGLVVAVFAVYYPAWRGGFLWEDVLYAETNPLLTASDGWRRIWFSLDSPAQYFPLTHSLFRLEKAFWGTNLLAHHLINIALHAGSALIVWRLLRRLAVPGAWLGAALFALHPVQVETVAQISELKNVLMGLFFIASLYFWARYREEKNANWWIASFVCYLLALAAKTNACVLPAVLPLILWWRRERFSGKTLLEIVPFAIFGAGAAALAILWERLHNTSSSFVMNAGLIERALIASRALFFYLGKLLWPLHLIFNYPAWNFSSGHPLDFIWPAAVALLAFAIFLLRRRAGRGPEVAVLYFVVALSPFLGFVAIYTFRYSYVADHYQYLASIGPLVLIAGAATMATRHYRTIQSALMASALVLLAYLTWRQAHNYKDADTLWIETIRQNPESWVSENNYGTVLVARGDYRLALAHFTRGYQLNPADMEVARNMGLCLMDLQRPASALPYLEQATQLDDRDTNTRRDLGRALLQLNRVNEAAGVLERVIQIKPNDAKARTLLAATLIQQGQHEEAMTHLRAALLAQPDDAETMTQVANLYLQSHRDREAADLLRQILNLRPDDPDALKNYAWLLATASESDLRNGAHAVVLAERARARAPENPFIQATLAAAYAEAGRFAEARAVAQNALRFAAANNLSGLADLLKQEIALFESRQPVREDR